MATNELESTKELLSSTQQTLSNTLAESRELKKQQRLAQPRIQALQREEELLTEFLQRAVEHAEASEGVEGLDDGGGGAASAAAGRSDGPRGSEAEAGGLATGLAGGLATGDVAEWEGSRASPRGGERITGGVGTDGACCSSSVGESSSAALRHDPHAALEIERFCAEGLLTSAPHPRGRLAAAGAAGAVAHADLTSRPRAAGEATSAAGGAADAASVASAPDAAGARGAATVTAAEGAPSSTCIPGVGGLASGALTCGGAGGRMLSEGCSLVGTLGSSLGSRLHGNSLNGGSLDCSGLDGSSLAGLAGGSLRAGGGGLGGGGPGSGGLGSGGLGSGSLHSGTLSGGGLSGSGLCNHADLAALVDSGRLSASLASGRLSAVLSAALGAGLGGRSLGTMPLMNTASPLTSAALGNGSRGLGGLHVTLGGGLGSGLGLGGGLGSGLGGGLGGGLSGIGGGLGGALGGSLSSNLSSCIGSLGSAHLSGGVRLPSPSVDSGQAPPLDVERPT